VKGWMGTRSREGAVHVAEERTLADAVCHGGGGGRGEIRSTSRGRKAGFTKYPFYFIKYPLIWIATTNRDPIIFQKTPFILQNAP
jgi:hypothetical protein